MDVRRGLRERSSLHVRTVAFVVLVCLVLLALGLHETWVSYNTRLRQGQRETENLARSLALHVEDMFEAADAATLDFREAFLSDGTGPAAIARLERSMRLRIATQKLFHGFLLLDRHGNWVASALSPEQADRFRSSNFAGKDFFEYPRTHPADGVAIGEPAWAKHDSKWVVSVSRRIDDPDGSFAGVIVTSIAFDLLQDFFATLPIGSKGSVALTSDRGIIMVHRPYDDLAVGRSVAQGDFFRKITDSTHAGSADFTSALNGDQKIGSFQRIPRFKLIVFVSLAKDEILAPWRRSVQDQLLWLTIALLPVVSIGYLLSVQINRRARAEQDLALSHRTLEQRVIERTSELQLAREKAEQASRAKSAFLNLVSHELRTPLTQLDLQLEMHRRQFRDQLSAKQERTLANISSAMHRLAALVGSILEYSRVKGERLRARPERFDVAELVEKIYEAADAQAKGRGLDVTFRAERPMPDIFSDRALVGIVVNNLVDNAIKYTSEGSVSISVSVEGDSIHIEVADTGIGIPAEFQQRMFEPFEQAEDVDRKHLPGVGLGLALVKEIVGLLGGEIRFSSEIERGSVFVFVLPLTLERPTTREEANALDPHH